MMSPLDPSLGGLDTCTVREGSSWSCSECRAASESRQRVYSGEWISESAEREGVGGVRGGGRKGGGKRKTLNIHRIESRTTTPWAMNSHALEAVIH